MNEGVLLAALATRTAIVATVVIVGLRLFGKRQLGQMNIYDLAMIMALSNAVQNAMTRGSGHLLAGIASAATLLLVSGIVVALVLRHPGAEPHLIGSPTLLAHDGRLIPGILRRSGITRQEMMAALRERGLSDLSNVLNATLEVDGTISIVTTDTESRRHPDPLQRHRPRDGRIES